MMEISELSAMLLLHNARPLGRFAQGSFMTGQQLQACTEGGADEPPLEPGIYLCGSLHPDCFKLTRSHAVRHLEHLYISPRTGTAYAMLAQQLGRWQHRFVVQLLGEDLRDVAARLTTLPLHFCLEDAHTGEALLKSGTLDSRKLFGVTDHAKVTPQNRQALAREACEVNARMLQPKAMVGAGLPEVREVCVTSVQCDALATWTDEEMSVQLGLAPQ